MSGVIMREALHVWEQGIYGNPLYLSWNFVVNLKLLLKKSLKRSYPSTHYNIADFVGVWTTKQGTENQNSNLFFVPQLFILMKIFVLMPFV